MGLGGNLGEKGEHDTYSHSLALCYRPFMARLARIVIPGLAHRGNRYHVPLFPSGDGTSGDSANARTVISSRSAAHALAGQSGGGSSSSSSSSGGSNSCTAANNGVDSAFRKLLDQMAHKAIPASPWKTVSGIANCINQFASDLGNELKNNFPNVSNNQALTNLNQCIQNVEHGMTEP